MRRSEQRRRAVFALYQHDITGRALEDLFERDDSEFTRALAEGALAAAGELDPLIERHAHGWELERLAPLDRALLRLSAFEMLHRDDVPDEVAIDEAVELAKRYCGADAPGFVNGILGAIRREAVPSEGDGTGDS